MELFKYSILSLILFISSTTFGQQVPGYQGKRLLIDAGVGLMPAVAGPTKNGKSITDNDYLALNTRLRLGLHYAAFRYLTFRLEHDRYTTAYWDQMWISNDSYNTFNELKVRSYGIGADITGQKWGTWGLAPIGFSYGFSVDYGYATPTIGFPTSEGLDESTQAILKEMIEVENYTFLVWGIRFNTKTILIDKVVLSTGLNFGLVSSLNPQAINSDVLNTTPLIRRIKSHSRANFHIGIGYLIY